MTARHVVRRAADAEYLSAAATRARSDRPRPLARGRLRRRSIAHRLRHLPAGTGRRDPRARALVRGVVPPARGRGDPRRPPRRRFASSPATTACFPIGVPHSWQGDRAARRRGPTCSRRPRVPQHGWDTYRVPDIPGRSPTPVDPRDPRTRSFGSITADHMNPGRQSQELLAVSASMRTALLVYSGISLKMMVDSDLGAVLHTMFMVQYEPDGVAGPHDHPLEEAYLITDGEVDATFDGEEYRLQAGRHRMGGRRAACTPSARPVRRCAGSRPSRRRCPPGMPTASPATGTTCTTH